MYEIQSLCTTWRFLNGETNYNLIYKGVLKCNRMYRIKPYVELIQRICRWENSIETGKNKEFRSRQMKLVNEVEHQKSVTRYRSLQAFSFLFTCKKKRNSGLEKHTTKFRRHENSRCARLVVKVWKIAHFHLAIRKQAKSFHCVHGCNYLTSHYICLFDMNDCTLFKNGFCSSLC